MYICIFFFPKTFPFLLPDIDIYHKRLVKTQYISCQKASMCLMTTYVPKHCFNQNISKLNSKVRRSVLTLIYRVAQI